MKLLFIKLKHIGDTLIMTATLNAVKQVYPETEIWVVIRKGTEGILAGCMAIDHILTAAPPRKEQSQGVSGLSQLALIKILRKRRFDKVFELSDGDRGRWLALLSNSKDRYMDGGPRNINAWWRHWFHVHNMSIPERRHFHRTQKDHFIVKKGLDLPINPGALIFDISYSQRPASDQLPQSFIVLHAGSRWQRKRWPVENWAALGNFLISEGHDLILSVGPDEQEIKESEQLQRLLSAPVYSTEGKASWAELAWLLHQAKLFIGVDTAAMHLAAACQCKTIALFGPSIESYWSPWAVEHQIVTPLKEVHSVTQRKVSDITVEQVARAANNLLQPKLLASIYQ